MVRSKYKLVSLPSAVQVIFQNNNVHTAIYRHRPSKYSKTPRLHFETPTSGFPIPKSEHAATTICPTREPHHITNHVLVKSSQCEQSLRKGRHVSQVCINNGLHNIAASVDVTVEAVQEDS